MQDKNSGEIIELQKDNVEKLREATQELDQVQEMLQQTSFDPAKMVEKLKSSGYCVLHLNEVVIVKENPFKVQKFDKKSIFLTPTKLDDVSKMGFRQGEQMILKNGNFVVSSFGKGALILRGIPGTSNFDGQVIEDFRKKQLKSILKTKKEQ
jgi:hypothetical protein